MKTLCLVILTLFALYNPKVEARTVDVDLHFLENIETEIDSIIINKSIPLAEIDENLKNYVELIALFDKVQIYNVDLTNKLLAKIQNHNTLSGNDLYLIKKAFSVYSDISAKMNTFSEIYEIKASTIAKILAKNKINSIMVKAHLIRLTSNLIAMENLEAIHNILYLNDNEFRKIFKNSFDNSNLTIEEKKTLKELTHQVNSLLETIDSRKFQQQIILIRNVSDKLKVDLASDSKSLTLIDIINTNKIATEIAQGKKVFKIDMYMMSDSISRFFTKITNVLSAFFGNVSGNIRWRKGYLYDNEEVLKVAKKSLRPMDIILEKSPFVLTDKFIPGHYGHVAIYLGTKEQLDEIGMWTHPSIVPYHDYIEAGNTILEAVRSGVRLNSVDDFLNIDEYTIVRKSDGLTSYQQVAEQIMRGMGQIGKAYDFNFDISTLDKIVCSELVYIVFGHVSWPTQYRFGRPTITPDDIGEVLFQKNTPFKMSDYVISTKRHEIQTGDMNTLAEVYDYELRTENGEEVKDEKDPTNSFWKKEIKCYTIMHALAKGKRCNTTYKEFTYEQDAGI